MALSDKDLKVGLTYIGNRNDFCYLCAKEIQAENKKDYLEILEGLKGKLEGKKCIKFMKNGTETCVCLEHIHKIAKENPL